VPVEVFESTIDEAEERLGLKNQPRVVIFHERKAGGMRIASGRGSTRTK
jgi:hypothetical protein